MAGLPHRLREVTAAQDVAGLVRRDLAGGRPRVEGVGDGVGEVRDDGRWDGPGPVGVFAVGALSGEGG